MKNERKLKSKSKKKYKVVWTCDFCKKEFDTKKESDKHELTCKKNPNFLKNSKKFLKLSKISKIIWIVSVALFFLLVFLANKFPQFSYENSKIPSYFLTTIVIIGIVSFLVTVISLALNLSYGKHFNEKPSKKFFRFIVSLIFLPILVIKDLSSVFFGFFILLPIWGLGVVFMLLVFGVITTSTPVKGNSMNPTILNEEHIDLSSFTFLNKLFFKPQKGDIITFESGRTSNPEGGEIVSYIKRIVAVGGDIVSIRDGFLYVNNELVKEPYTAKPRSTFGGSFLADCKTITIPDGYYFVLGDNRKRSKDSRDIGLVSVKEIESILSIKKQEKYQDRLRDASNDGTDHGLPSFDLDDYYQRINKIREDNDLKPLKRNEKLEKAALARAKSVIENNEVELIGKNEKSKYPYTSAIRDAGYYNTTTGEIITTGYYDSEELSTYWLDYETKKNLLDKQFQDTGIASYVGKIDDCEIQVIVQEFGGYVPPNYDKSNIEGWESTLNRLREIQPSWQKCKEWGSKYENNKTACDRINEIISIRISNISAAINRMRNNQWLSTAESNGLQQDQALYNEQESLATKLNNL